MIGWLLMAVGMVVSVLAAPFSFVPLPPASVGDDLIPSARVTVQGKTPVTVFQNNLPYPIDVNGTLITPRSTVWNRGQTYFLALKSDGTPYTFITPTYSITGFSPTEAAFSSLDLSDLKTELYDASEPVSSLQTTAITGGQISWNNAGCLTAPENYHTALVNVAIDSQTLQRFNGSISEVIDYFFAYYTMVSLRYQNAFGVRIVIRNMQIGGSSFLNTAQPGGNPDILLLLMRTFRTTGFGTAMSIVHHSKLPFTGVVGRAGAFSLCTDSAVGWATFTFDFAKAFLVGVHEMGHIFGSLHDGDPPHSLCAGQCLDCTGCECKGSYIMNAFVNNATQFSACSQQSICNLINNRLQFAKYGDCLKTPSCGNGICDTDGTDLGCFRDCPVCGDLFCQFGEICPQDCEPPRAISFRQVYNETRSGYKPVLNLTNPYPLISARFTDGTSVLGRGQILVPWRFLESRIEVAVYPPQHPLLYSLGTSLILRELLLQNASFTVPHQLYQVNVYQINETGHQNTINNDLTAFSLFSRFDHSSFNENNIRTKKGVIAYADVGKSLTFSFYRFNTSSVYSENCTLPLTPSLSFRSIRFFTITIFTEYSRVKLYRNRNYMGELIPEAGRVYYHTCYVESGLTVQDPVSLRNTTIPILAGRSQLLFF